MPVKHAFYSSCNSIFMHSDNLNELPVLSLQESYSLSVLMYAVPAMWLVLPGLSRLNISHMIMLRKVKFYKHMFLSANSVLCNVLCNVITPITICYALYSYICLAVDSVLFCFMRIKMFIFAKDVHIPLLT